MEEGGKWCFRQFFGDEGYLDTVIFPKEAFRTPLFEPANLNPFIKNTSEPQSAEERQNLLADKTKATTGKT
ncbi:MAG: hypothetical protein ACUVXA_03670 [Candidatus Jordarchaeum sp.]|uniref:hypothetical protein n=1 Tax=Candidatus Jordarchaeum sp. TaxID=2823881 RepID=UPI0040497BAF